MAGVLANLLSKSGKTDFAANQKAKQEIKKEEPSAGLKPPPPPAVQREVPPPAPQHAVQAAAAPPPIKRQAQAAPDIKREAPPPAQRRQAQATVKQLQIKREAAVPPQRNLDAKAAAAAPPQKRQHQVPPAVARQSRDRNAGLECSASVREALDEFRKLESKLKREGNPKPDMKAFKALKNKYTPAKKHGEIPGVPVGMVFHGRGEAAILGVHTQILRGFDAMKDNPCYAICVSGGYKDDDDQSPDGTIIYTGVGGQDKNRRQVKDQEENFENGSLVLSHFRKVPVRVLRGRLVDKRPEYVYEGLYTCVGYDRVPSEDGPLIYKFTLKPMDPEKSRSFEVDFDPSRGSAAGGGGSKRKAGSSRSRLDKKLGNSTLQGKVAERLKRPRQW